MTEPKLTATLLANGPYVREEAPFALLAPLGPSLQVVEQSVLKLERSQARRFALQYYLPATKSYLEVIKESPGC